MQLSEILSIASVVLLTVSHGQILIDPRTRYSNLTISLPPPSFPSLEIDFEQPPDHGETSYIGSGRLRGRRALITGGDSGIGRAVAIAFVREGASVAINYLPGEEADAETLVDLLRRENRTITRLPGDLRNESFCEELISAAHERLGGLDVLVSNAGYHGLGAPGLAPIVSNLSTAMFDQIIHTNIYPQLFLSRAAVPLMAPGSAIIYTGTMAILDPYVTGLAYIASKGFINSWSLTLSRQLVPFGIRVNEVRPPAVYTAFYGPQGYTSEQLRAVGRDSTLGRLMQPAEIASAYVDLADTRSSYTTGASWGFAA